MANPNLNPEWVGVKVYIGTSLSGTTWSYSALCAGIESISPSVNEQNQQAFYMCGQGGACNVVTGIAPEYDVSGSRVHGDAAQDYICGLRYKLGQDRYSSLKVEIYDNTTKKEEIVADCTITDIVDFGGAATDLVPFSCKLRVNGLPTVTTTF